MKFYITIFIFLFSGLAFALEARIFVSNDCPGKTIILKEHAHQKDLIKAYFESNFLTLETCYKYGGYFRCGSRDINDPNFFKNAKINIEKYKLNILQYEKLVQEIPELQEVTAKNLEFMKFNLFKAELLLNFYQTFDIDILKTIYKGLQIPEELPYLKKFKIIKNKTLDTFDELLLTIENLPDNFQKYHAARYYWNTVLNQEYHKQHNPPGYEEKKEVWKKFVAKYNIIEEYDNSDCD